MNLHGPMTSRAAVSGTRVVRSKMHVCPVAVNRCEVRGVCANARLRGRGPRGRVTYRTPSAPKCPSGALFRRQAATEHPRAHGSTSSVRATVPSANPPRSSPLTTGRRRHAGRGVVAWWRGVVRPRRQRSTLPSHPGRNVDVEGSSPSSAAPQTRCPLAPRLTCASGTFCAGPCPRSRCPTWRGS